MAMPAMYTFLIDSILSSVDAASLDGSDRARPPCGG